MSENFLDNAALAHPLLARMARDRINRFFKTSAASNMLCCAAASLAAGLLFGNGPLYTAAFIVMLIVWGQASVLCGFRRQWFFVFFTAAFHLLPHLFISAAESATQTEELAPLNGALADISELFVNGAFGIFGDFAAYAGIACTAVFILLYFAGSKLRVTAKRSDFYCRARLEQLDKA